MSAKKTPKMKTKSTPNKRVKPRAGVYLEQIEPPSPAADMEVVGRTSRRGGVAVHGVHTGDGNGVVGEAREGITAGVLGIHSGPKGAGVAGQGFGDAVGVRGTGGTNGVLGEGAIGVRGISSRTGFAAVWGDHLGAGVGVVGDVAVAGDGIDGTAGVLGRHKGVGGHGVRGEGEIGVVGKGNPFGPGVFGSGAYGGQFFGTKAQLSLVAATTRGRPTTGAHIKGEIFADSRATLFVCVDSGTPGTWRRIMTEPAE